MNSYLWLCYTGNHRASARYLIESVERLRDAEHAVLLGHWRCVNKAREMCVLSREPSVIYFKKMATKQNIGLFRGMSVSVRKPTQLKLLVFEYNLI